MSARRIASRAASVPSSTAGVSANDPRNFPIGVRAPSMMTAVSTASSLRAAFGAAALAHHPEDARERRASVDRLGRRDLAGLDTGRMPADPRPERRQLVG